MAIYESVVILDSLLPPKEIDAAIEHFSSVITDNGGKVRSVDKWGKRRLAYEIRKKQYGFYFAIEFEGTGNIPAALQADYNYNDNVMRYLTYVYDKHKINAKAKKAAAEAEQVKAPVAGKSDKEKPAPVAKEEQKVVEPEVVEKKAEAIEETDKGEVVDEATEVKEETKEKEA